MTELVTVKWRYRVVAAALVVVTALSGCSLSGGSNGLDPPNTGPVKVPLNAKRAALRQIVMIDAGSKFGAGIIVGASDNKLIIATAKHVVDDAIDDREGQNTFAAPSVYDDQNNGTVKVGFRKTNGEATPMWKTGYVGNEKFVAGDGQLLDLAVVRVDLGSSHGGDLRQLARSSIMRNDMNRLRGANALVVGNRNNDGWTTSGVGQPGYVMDVVDTSFVVEDTPSNEGDSGGGVFDHNFHLMGMAIAITGTQMKAYRIGTISRHLESAGISFALQAATTNYVKPIYVEPVTGALGTGNKELRDAMVKALRAAGYAVQVDVAADQFVRRVRTRVTVENAGLVSKNHTITWSIVDTSEKLVGKYSEDVEAYLGEKSSSFGQSEADSLARAAVKELKAALGTALVR